MTDKADLKQLLKQLEEINNFFLPINVLEITGMHLQEIKHSNVLAWMFGDNLHQLGYEILEKFLGKVAKNNRNTGAEKLTKKLKDYVYSPEHDRNIEIKREHTIYSESKTRTKCIIDLLIHDKKNNSFIVIENKVRSGESDNQIADYQKAIEENLKTTDIYFIYLTPAGEEPTKENWLIADYQIIYDIIDKVLKSKSRDIPDQARMILESYNELLIKEGIVSNNELQELCAEIWRNEEYKKALNLIIQYEPNGVPEFLIALRKRLKDDEGFELINYEKNAKSDFAVIPKNYKYEIPEAGDPKQFDKTFWFGCYVTRSNIGIQIKNIDKLDDDKQIMINNLKTHGFPSKNNANSKWIDASKMIDKEIYKFGKYDLSDIDDNELIGEFIKILKSISEAVSKKTTGEQ